jgi:hypothetical protein
MSLYYIRGGPRESIPFIFCRHIRVGLCISLHQAQCNATGRQGWWSPILGAKKQVDAQVQAEVDSHKPAWVDRLSGFVAVGFWFGLFLLLLTSVAVGFEDYPISSQQFEG